MYYQFLDYTFDSTSLTLQRQGKDIDIRHNEGKLLALLLDRRDEVLSKEAILDAVWKGKVVSEQAVFQNISHLRNLFGNDAIKTFPKRGYQWQLDISICNQPTVQTTAESSVPVKKQHNYWKYIALAGMFIVISGFLGFSGEQPGQIETQQQHKVAYINFAGQLNETTINLSDNEKIDFTLLPNLDSATFAATSTLAYQDLAKTHPIVLNGTVRMHQGTYFARFILKGPHGDWSGQLSGTTKAELTHQLITHLSQPTIFDYVNKRLAPEHMLASLSLAHATTPNDLILLDQLTRAYINHRELDKAMVMADKLATLSNQQNRIDYQGKAFLLQSRILSEKELYELSQEKLMTAITHFESINDLEGHANALYAKSWLDHQANDYDTLKQSLLTSSELNRQAQNIAQEIESLTYLSVMAHKHKQQQDKYSYLQLAESKMRSYNLPDYHYAKIPFHYAIFAETPAAKEPHYKQVLEITKLTPDYWVARNCRRSLVQYYIAENRLYDAKQIVAQVTTDNVHNAYLHTLIAQQEGDTQALIDKAHYTFELAQMANQRFISLDTALILYGIDHANINHDFYRQYIDDNKSVAWQTRNQDELTRLGLIES